MSNNRIDVVLLYAPTWDAPSQMSKQHLARHWAEVESAKKRGQGAFETLLKGIGRGLPVASLNLKAGGSGGPEQVTNPLRRLLRKLSNERRRCTRGDPPVAL